MNKFIFILLLTLSVNMFTMSQNADTINGKKENKLEFNIGISDIFAKSLTELLLLDYWDYYYYPDLFFNPMQTNMVVGLKLHNKKGAFRFNTGFHFDKQNYDDVKDPEDSNEIQTIQTYLNLGYEWHSNFNKVTVFYGFDINGGYQNYKIVNDDSYSKDETEFKILSQGISPLIGVNYFLTPKLSLGTEIKFNVYMYSGKNKTKKTYYNDPPYPDNQEYEYNYSGIRTNFGPLGYLSVNIYF